MRQRAQRLLANAPRRDVDDAHQAHTVIGIVKDAQIGHHILDLPALVEPGRPHQLVGHSSPHKSILYRARLGIGAIHHRAVPQLHVSLRHQAPDLAHHHVAFFLLVVGFQDNSLEAAVPLGEEALGMAMHVARDHGVGDIEDGLGRAVIPLQHDDAGMGIILAKAGHVPVIGSAEAIDRLVLVTHHKEICPVACQ